ncbi:MAG: hypothetical protein ACPGUD_13870 [Parashewanella sp.]
MAVFSSRVEYLSPSTYQTRRINIESKRCLRSAPAHYDIPRDSPSYDSVTARGVQLELNQFLNINVYAGSIKLILPDEKDWTMLCEFDDFVGNSLELIEKEVHLETCERFFKARPALYAWVYRTSLEESLDLRDRVIQYKALSLDWSRSFYRADQLAEIPKFEFNWRKMMSPDEMKHMFQVKRKNERYVQSEEYKLAMHRSVRVHVLKRSLLIRLAELTEHKPNKGNRQVIKFRSALNHFLMLSPNCPEKYQQFQLRGNKVMKIANRLIRSGVQNTKDDFESLPETLDLYMKKWEEKYKLPSSTKRSKCK